MLKTRRTFTKLSAALLGALAISPLARAADDDIVIGHHGPLTGPASWVGLGGRDGAMMAMDDINAAGGINGRKLRMISYDDAGKPSEAELVARKMIESDKVFAILGSGVSATAVAVAQDAHRAKIPYFNGTGSTVKIIDAQSRWVFSGASNDSRDSAENEATFIGNYLKVKKVAVIHQTDENSTQVAEGVLRLIKERYGVEVLTRQTYNPGETDFTSQLLAVRRTNPEYILLFSYYVEAARLVRQARELGIKTPIKGDGSITNAGFLTVAGPAAEGMIVSYSPLYYRGNQVRDMVEFEARFKAKYPSYPADRPNLVDCYGYGNMYALAEGMRRAGKDMTRKGLVDALETLNEFKPSENWPKAVNVTQPITYTVSHNGNRRLSFFKVVNGTFQPIVEYKAPVPTLKFPANASLNW